MTVIAWAAFVRGHRLGHLGRSVVVRVTGLVVLHEQAAVPLVIVNVAPRIRAGAAAREGDRVPPAALAATVNCEPKTAEDGACVVTVIDWAAFDRGHRLGHLRRSVVVRVTGLVVLDRQAVVPLVIVNVAPVFEQPPPLENVTALPEPPPVAATVNCELKTRRRRRMRRDRDRLGGLLRGHRLGHLGAAL